MSKEIKKKSAKEASTIFHNIIGASVKGNPKPEATYYSKNKKQDSILIKNIVLALDKDYEHEPVYCIQFVTKNGTKPIWDYNSKELRDKELKEILENWLTPKEKPNNFFYLLWSNSYIVSYLDNKAGVNFHTGKLSIAYTDHTSTANLIAKSELPLQ